MNQNPSPLSTLTPLQKAHYVLNSFLEIQRIADETYELGGFVLEDLKQLIDTLSRLEPAAVSSENDGPQLGEVRDFPPKSHKRSINFK